MPKNVQITVHLCSFHMLARVYSKSFKLGFSSTWNENFQMHKIGLEKAEEPEIKLSTFAWLLRKQRNCRKTSTSASLITLKPLCVSQQTGKFLKRWRHKTTLPVSWEIWMWVKKQQLEPDMEKQTGSKLGKEYNKGVYCQYAYLTYTQVPQEKCYAVWITNWN